jgi:Putative adhesin
VTRRLLALLIIVVGLAGVAVALLSDAVTTEDRGSTTHPGPIRSVVVAIDAGRVDVVGSADPDAKVDRVRHYLHGAPTISETVSDGVLRLAADCPRFIALQCRVDVRLQIPVGATVQVRTDKGDVSVDGMKNMVDVTTSAGAVRLTRDAGPVKVVTSAGSIDGVDLTPPSLDASTDAGRIRVSLAEPASRVDLRTHAGSIDLALPPAPGGYRVTANTGAGKANVSVAQDPTSPRAVTARTGAGSIRIHPR